MSKCINIKKGKCKLSESDHPGGSNEIAYHPITGHCLIIRKISHWGLARGDDCQEMRIVDNDFES